MVAMTTDPIPKMAKCVSISTGTHHSSLLVQDDDWLLDRPLMEGLDGPLNDGLEGDQDNTINGRF